MNQRVLVTAGASGIGREIARSFAGNGGQVYVCDIDAAALDKLAQELPGVITKVCDIGNPQDIGQMVTYGAEALGGFDVLVNNAGIAGPTAPAEEFDPAAWEQVVQINFTGTFHVTRLVIPYLRQSAAGVIINMSWLAGLVMRTEALTLPPKGESSASPKPCLLSSVRTASGPMPSFRAP